MLAVDIFLELRQTRHCVNCVIASQLFQEPFKLLMIGLRREWTQCELCLGGGGKGLLQPLDQGGFECGADD